MASEELPGVVKGGALLVIGALIGAAGAYFAAPRPSPEMPMPPEHDHAMHSSANGSHDGHAMHGALWEVPEGVPAPTVSLMIHPDPHGGWTLHVMTQNFRFAPEAASGAATAGEGHAHLYANGDKIARLYGPWYHISELPLGEVEIAVSLNTNDHQSISVAGAPVVARRTITVE